MALLWHPFLAATVNGSFGRTARRAWPLLLLAAVAFAATQPAFGHTGGMFKDSIDYPHDFDEYGCTSCHTDHPGQGNAYVNGPSAVNWTFVDAKGKLMAGNKYAKGAVYTVTITLSDEQAANKDNHAGFNLRASAGKFEALASDGHVQVSKDGSQATHKDPKETQWSMKWTAPDSGGVSFELWVNDVNGNGLNDGADQVHAFGFWLTDEKGAQVGAASEGAVEYGISLQQYWIGLIGLMGMIVVMVGAFAYLKFANPHNTDAKDR